MLDVHVRSCHDAHIGLTHLAAAHTDILSIFQHTQQSRLCAQRQLSHLIQEQCSAVGSAEVTLVLAYGPRESTLLMTEELTVDGALRDATTVDSEVFTCATQAVVVNQAGDNLLTHTALTRDEHREVGLGHLQCCVQGMIQRLAVSYDAVALLNRL